MFQIAVQDDSGREVGTFRCEGKACSAGRNAGNLICLIGWRIAATHARFERGAEGIFVTNVSGGALLVNGQQITTFGPLAPTDVITLSSYRLQVLDEAAPGPAVREAPEEVDEYQPQPPAAEPVKPDPETFGVRAHADTAGEAANDRFQYHNLIHHKLMQAMDLRRTDVESMGEEQLAETIKGLIGQIIGELDKDLPADIDRQRLGREVLNEAVGLGPLEDFLADESITEIMVNSYDDVYIERHGRLEHSRVTFSSNEAVRSVIDRIVSPLGRRIDESSPMVDGRLKDGSRVNAVIPPLALKGPCLTIRKFSKHRLSTQDLIGFGSMDGRMVQFLKTTVLNRKNIIISGGTGTGKTTFLNVLSSFIPHTERIITVEDSAELRLNQPHVVSLEARPANMEGIGEISIRDLVRNCLRMRPDRIVVGECRGGEALDMLQAMNTGHDGSLTTVHANSPRDLIGRLEVMVMMAGMELPDKAIREQVVSAVEVIIQLSRFADGSRKITHISEITGLESDVVQMQEIFRFAQHGVDENGKILGEFLPTGRIPEFYEELRSQGQQVDMSIFGSP